MIDIEILFKKFPYFNRKRCHFIKRPSGFFPQPFTHLPCTIRFFPCRGKKMFQFSKWKRTDIWFLIYCFHGAKVRERTSLPTLFSVKKGDNIWLRIKKCVLLCNIMARKISADINFPVLLTPIKNGVVVTDGGAKILESGSPPHPLSIEEGELEY